MGRLQDDFLIRVETFCDRVLDVTEAAARARCPRRLIEQIAAAGSPRADSIRSSQKPTNSAESSVP